jgi:hypothetical protein
VDASEGELTFAKAGTAAAPEVAAA